MTVEAQDIGGYAFTKACDIQPIRDSNGVVVPLFPQSRYTNKRGLPLHKYGEGPFCEFKIIPGLLAVGVYIIFVIAKLKYIGKCERGLSQRFNMQYGRIDPSDCYKGGQQTNCRLNHLMYIEALKNNGIDVWFFATPKFIEIESELIGRFRPFPPDSWNLR